MDNQIFPTGPPFLDELPNVCTLCGMLFNSAISLQHHMQLHILSAANAQILSNQPPDPGLAMNSPANILDLISGVSHVASSGNTSLMAAPPLSSVPAHLITPTIGLASAPLQNVTLHQQMSKVKEKKPKTASKPPAISSASTPSSGSATSRKSVESNSSTYISTFPKDLQKLDILSSPKPQSQQNKEEKESSKPSVSQFDQVDEALTIPSFPKSSQFERPNTSSQKQSTKKDPKLFQPFVTSEDPIDLGYGLKSNPFFAADSLVSPVKSSSDKPLDIDVLNTPQKVSYPAGLGGCEDLSVSTTAQSLPVTTASSVSRKSSRMNTLDVFDSPQLLDKIKDAPAPKSNTPQAESLNLKSQFYPGFIDPLNVSPKSAQIFRDKDDTIPKLPLQTSHFSNSGSSSPDLKARAPLETDVFTNQADTPSAMVSPSIDLIGSTADMSPNTQKSQAFGSNESSSTVATLPPAAPQVFPSTSSSNATAGVLPNIVNPPPIGIPDLTSTNPLSTFSNGTGYFNALTQKLINPGLPVGADFGKPNTSFNYNTESKGKSYFENGILINQDYDKISDTNDEDDLERLIDDIDTKDEHIDTKGYSEIEDLLNEFNEQHPEDMTKSKNQMYDFLNDVPDDGLKDKDDSKAPVNVLPDEDIESTKRAFQISEILEKENEIIEKESKMLENARLSASLPKTIDETATLTSSSTVTTSAVVSESSKSEEPPSASGEHKKEDDHVDFDIPKVGKLMKIRKYFQIQEQKKKEQTQSTEQGGELKIQVKESVEPEKPQTILVQVSKRKKIEYGPYINRQSLLEGKPKNQEPEKPQKQFRPKPKPQIPARRTFNLRARTTKTDFASLATRGSKTAEVKKTDEKGKAADKDKADEKTKDEESDNAKPDNIQINSTDTDIKSVTDVEKSGDTIEKEENNDETKTVSKITTRNKESKKEQDSARVPAKSKSAKTSMPPNLKEKSKGKDSGKELHEKKENEDHKPVLRTRSAKTDTAAKGDTIAKTDTAITEPKPLRRRLFKQASSTTKSNKDQDDVKKEEATEKNVRKSLRGNQKTTPDKADIKKCSVNLGENLSESKIKAASHTLTGLKDLKDKPFKSIKCGGTDKVRKSERQIEKNNAEKDDDVEDVSNLMSSDDTRNRAESISHSFAKQYENENKGSSNVENVNGNPGDKVKVNDKPDMTNADSKSDMANTEASQETSLSKVDEQSAELDKELVQNECQEQNSSTIAMGTNDNKNENELQDAGDSKPQVVEPKNIFDQMGNPDKESDPVMGDNPVSLNADELDKQPTENLALEESENINNSDKVIDASKPADTEKPLTVIRLKLGPDAQKVLKKLSENARKRKLEKRLLQSGTCIKDENSSGVPKVANEDPVLSNEAEDKTTSIAQDIDSDEHESFDSIKKRKLDIMEKKDSETAADSSKETEKKVKFSVENEFQRLVDEAMAEVKNAEKGESSKQERYVNLRKRLNESIKYDVDNSDDDQDLKDEMFVTIPKARKMMQKTSKTPIKGIGKTPPKVKQQPAVFGSALKQNAVKRDMDVYDFTDTELSDKEDPLPTTKLNFKPKYVSNIKMFSSHKSSFLPKPVAPVGNSNTFDSDAKMEGDKVDSETGYDKRTVEPLKIKLSKIIPFKEKKHKHKHKKKRKKEKKRRVSESVEDVEVAGERTKGQAVDSDIDSNEGQTGESPQHNGSRKRKSSNKYKKFICPYCNQGFCQSCDLKKHVMIHTGERPWPCEVCDKKFLRKTDLVKHTRTHTGEKPYACDFCNKRVSDKSQWNVHRRLHTGDRPYQCTLCGKGCITSSELTRHRANHLNSEEKLHKCEMCRQTFKIKECLGMHMKMHYKTRDKLFKCEKCVVGYDHKEDLERHVCVEPKPNLYVCSECFTEFTDELSYVEHIKTHDLNVFSCNICTHIFDDQNALETHLCSLGVDSKQPHCDICDQDFSDQAALSQHTCVKNEGGQSFMCEHCSETFTVQKEFEEHCLKHTVGGVDDDGGGGGVVSDSEDAFRDNSSVDDGRETSHSGTPNSSIDTESVAVSLASPTEITQQDMLQQQWPGGTELVSPKAEIKKAKEMRSVFDNGSRASVIAGNFRNSDVNVIKEMKGEKREPSCSGKGDVDVGGASDKNVYRTAGHVAKGKVNLLHSERIFETSEFSNSPDFSSLTDEGSLNLDPFDKIAGSSQPFGGIGEMKTRNVPFHPSSSGRSVGEFDSRGTNRSVVDSKRVMPSAVQGPANSAQSEQDFRWPGAFQISANDYVNSLLNKMGSDHSEPVRDLSVKSFGGMKSDMSKSSNLLPPANRNDIYKDDIENQAKSDIFSDFDFPMGSQKADLFQSPSKGSAPQKFCQSGASGSTAFQGIDQNLYLPRNSRHYQDKSDYAYPGGNFLNTFSPGSYSVPQSNSLFGASDHDVSKRLTSPGSLFPTNQDVMQSNFYLNVEESMKGTSPTDKTDETAALLSNFDYGMN